MKRALLVAGVALLAYAGTWSSGFVFDDHVAIEENPVVRGTVPLHEVFVRDWWGHVRAMTAGCYRPVVVSLLRAEWVAGQGSPAFFHAITVLLHAAVVAAIYLVFRRIVSERVALAASLFFAVFAAASEAVETNVGQSDLVETLAILIGLAAHRRGGRGAAALAIVAYAVAVGSKETGLIAVGAWVLMELVLPSQVPWRSRLGRLAGYSAVATVYVVARVHATGTLVPATGDLVANPLSMNGPVGRLFGAGHVFVERYLLGMVNPFWRLHQCAFAACTPSNPTDGLAWAGLAVATGGVALVLMLRKKAPVLALGLGWFLIFFLPVSNLIVGGSTSYAERLIYLPAVGLALLVAALMDAVAARMARPRLAWALFATLVATNVVAVQLRHLDWRSDATLAASALRVAPDSAPALAMLATQAGVSGDFETSHELAQRAVRIWDHYGFGHNALAIALDGLGQTEGAEREFRRATELLVQSDLFANHAVFLARHGRYREALMVVQQRRKHDPDSPQLIALEEKLRTLVVR